MLAQFVQSSLGSLLPSKGGHRTDGPLVPTSMTEVMLVSYAAS